MFGEDPHDPGQCSPSGCLAGQIDLRTFTEAGDLAKGQHEGGLGLILPNCLVVEKFANPGSWERAVEICERTAEGPPGGEFSPLLSWSFVGASASLLQKVRKSHELALSGKDLRTFDSPSTRYFGEKCPEKRLLRASTTRDLRTFSAPLQTGPLSSTYMSEGPAKRTLTIEKSGIA